MFINSQLQKQNVEQNFNDQFVDQEKNKKLCTVAADHVFDRPTPYKEDVCGATTKQNLYK